MFYLVHLYFVQVLSHSMAATLETLVELGLLEDEAEATADFVNSFDQLFDVFNASNLRDTHPRKKPFNSKQIEFLQEAFKWLSGLKVLLFLFKTKDKKFAYLFFPPFVHRTSLGRLKFASLINQLQKLSLHNQFAI